MLSSESSSASGRVGIVSQSRGLKENIRLYSGEDCATMVDEVGLSVYVLGLRRRPIYVRL